MMFDEIPTFDEVVNAMYMYVLLKCGQLNWFLVNLKYLQYALYIKAREQLNAIYIGM